MPPEPRLDFPFLLMSFCAIFFNVMTVIYYVKVRNLKRQLEKLRNQPNNQPASVNNPYNSA
jgi:hypothetical protein